MVFYVREFKQKIVYCIPQAIKCDDIPGAREELVMAYPHKKYAHQFNDIDFEINVVIYITQNLWRQLLMQ